MLIGPALSASKRDRPRLKTIAVGFDNDRVADRGTENRPEIIGIVAAVAFDV